MKMDQAAGVDGIPGLLKYGSEGAVSIMYRICNLALKFFPSTV